MKRFLAMILASTMLFSQSVFAHDLDPNHWASEYMEIFPEAYVGEFPGYNEHVIKSSAVDYIEQINLYNEISKVTSYNSGEKLAMMFINADIDGYLTRGALAEILVQNADKYKFDIDTNIKVSFKDTKIKDIEKCVQYGLLNGYEDGTFKPDNYVTYAEMSIVLARYQAKAEEVIANFDANEYSNAPSQKAQEALDVYLEASAKFDNLKSYSYKMDMGLAVKATEDEEVEEMSINLAGEAKVIAAEDLIPDMEIKLKLSIPELEKRLETIGMQDEILVYSKDNFLYYDILGEKIKINIDDVFKVYEDMYGIELEQMGSGSLSEANKLMYQLMLKDASVKELNNGSNEIATKFNLTSMVAKELETSDVLSLEVIEGLEQFNDLLEFELVTVIDKDGRIISSNLDYDKTYVYEDRIFDTSIAFDISIYLDATYYDFDKTSFEMPNLEGYEDISSELTF